MQTITITVENDFLPDFYNFIKENNSIKIKDSDELTDAEKLKIDPYFYERRERLHQLSKDIESGKEQMLSHSEVWNEVFNRYK